MKKFYHSIMHITLPVLVISMTFPSCNAGADSVIRIIGDKSPATSGSSDERPVSNRGSKTIRIVGDKMVRPETPVGTETVEMVPQETTPPEETAEQLLAKRLADLKAESERKVAEKAEQERLAKRLADLKAESV